MAEVTLTEQNFEQEVLKASLPVLVDFWAPWCGPCVVTGPMVSDLAQEYAGKLKVGKMNVDDNPNIPSTYGVMSIPTFKFFKNGQEAAEVVGAVARQELKKRIDQVLKS